MGLHLMHKASRLPFLTHHVCVIPICYFNWNALLQSSVRRVNSTEALQHSDTHWCSLGIWGVWLDSEAQVPELLASCMELGLTSEHICLTTANDLAQFYLCLGIVKWVSGQMIQPSMVSIKLECSGTLTGTNYRLNFLLPICLCSAASDV